MKSYAIILLSVFSLLKLAAFPITKNGNAFSEIIIPEKCGKSVIYAAGELQKHIFKVSGAKLAVVTEKNANAKYQLHVGHTAKSQKFCPEAKALSGSSWIVKKIPDTIFMLGHDKGEDINARTSETGTLYAVYSFLEKQLNIRWLWPDETSGTFCPQQPDIVSGEHDYRGKPELKSTVIRRLPVSFLRKTGRIHFQEPHFQDKVNGHAFINYHKYYGKNHPEWFAHKEGAKLTPVTRQSSMCVSNPDLHREIVRRWEAERNRNPGKKIDINLCENDTAGGCMCASCFKWDDPDFCFEWMSRPGKNVGRRYAKFAWEVWKIASQIDPRVEVQSYIYKNYFFSPQNLKLNKQIVFFYVPPTEANFPRLPKMEKDLIENLSMWQKTGATIEYRPNIYGGYAMPENYVTLFYREFQNLRRAGMSKMDIDGPNTSFATQGPLLYVMSRLPAKPDAGLDDLLDEYYSAFGPAKKEVKAYWEFWKKYMLDNRQKFYEVPLKMNKLRRSPHFGWYYTFYAHVLYPPDILKQGDLLLNKALKVAQKDADALKKVHFLKQGLKHAMLCAEVCALFSEENTPNDSKLAALEKLNRFRTTMPAYCADLKLFRKNGIMEKAVWIFPDFDPDSMLKLPIEWKGITDPDNLGQQKEFFKKDLNDAAWKNVFTDRHLENQGIHDYNHAWYRLKITIPEKFRNRRTVLHLGAVDESCTLWINSQLAGNFRYNAAENPDSWEKPLDFDITKFIPQNGEITIVLKVTNEIGGGGLWKPSSLRFFESAPQQYCWDSNFFKKNISKLRGYKQYLFPEKLPDGTFACRVNGPNIGKLQPFFKCKVPFKFVAGKTYEIEAEMFMHSKTGDIRLLVLEHEGGRTSTRSHMISRNKIKDRWQKEKLRFTVGKNTLSLQVQFTVRNFSPGGYGLIRYMLLKEIPSQTGPQDKIM